MKLLTRAVGLLMSVMLPWFVAGTAFAADLTLTNSVVGFRSPIGIDFQETSGKLILSQNYPTGSPNNLDLADPVSGTFSQFSALALLKNELKIATVRASTCQPGSGFAVGEVFTGNGNPGQVIRISPSGASVLNPWVTLPGEPALVRGSLVQDRFGVAGCDLIVVTGNEQNGTVVNDDVGNVWRVNAAGVATKVATLGTHLEGVTTLPNDPATYGPAAGRILAGAEEFAIPAGPPTYDPAGGVIVAVNPNAVDDFFSIGGPGTIGFPGHTHYLTTVPFHPEDLDVIRRNSQFFGVAFRDGQVLTAPAANFDPFCGQVLITQEFPFAGTSGLSAMSWDGTKFVVRPLTSNRDGTIQQWEHVTFTSGQDCHALKVVKSPKAGDPASVFLPGAQASFTIVVTNTGGLPDDITLTDTLPGNGGLVWATASADRAGCVSPIVANTLNCTFLAVPPGASVTITVTSTATTPIAACQDQPNPAAIATDTHGNTVQDSGFLTCTPPPPVVTIKKYTNGADAQTPNDADVPNIAVGGAVTWRYEVKNVGLVPVARANLTVTDDHAGVTPVPVLVGVFVSGDTNTNDFLDPGETWIYQATGTALNLALTPLDPGKIVAGVCTHNGTESPRTGYVNQGKVTVLGGAPATDPSAYCNPPAPGVTIVKFTNGADANDPNAAGVPNIAAGGVVTWTYRVTNTGNTSIPRASVVVTDNTTGVTPTFTSEVTGNGDTTFNPGEVWLYTATGTALNLVLPPPAGVTTVANSCTAGGTQPPRTAYTNIGTVTIPGANATDPSSYCNPPAPNVTIIKFTNGADANDPNAAGVPNIAAGGVVTWTYRVTNTGNTSIPRANVVVTDNTTGVTPTFTSEVTGNGDTTFNPGEVWLYTATGTALNLVLPPPAGVHTVANSCTAGGTQPPRTAYTNVGTVTIPGATASDPSSYCNPPPQPPTGLIAPTQTTCQDYRDGTASALGQVNYSVSGGNIGQNINPGVFFYYTKITTTVPNQVVTVGQSNTSTNGAALFEAQQGQFRLYTGSCSSWTQGTVTGGGTTALFTIAVPGTYIISNKYSTKSIAGTNAPTPVDITYNFTTSLGGTTGASVLLKKQ